MPRKKSKDIEKETQRKLADGAKKQMENMDKRHPRFSNLEKQYFLGPDKKKEEQNDNKDVKFVERFRNQFNTSSNQNYYETAGEMINGYPYVTVHNETEDRRVKKKKDVNKPEKLQKTEQDIKREIVKKLNERPEAEPLTTYQKAFMTATKPLEVVINGAVGGAIYFVKNNARAYATGGVEGVLDNMNDKRDGAVQDLINVLGEKEEGDVGEVKIDNSLYNRRNGKSTVVPDGRRRVSMIAEGLTPTLMSTTPIRTNSTTPSPQNNLPKESKYARNFRKMVESVVDSPLGEKFLGKLPEHTGKVNQALSTYKKTGELPKELR